MSDFERRVLRLIANDDAQHVRIAWTPPMGDAIKSLIASGYVGKYPHEETGRYAITEAGRAALQETGQ